MGIDVRSYAQRGENIVRASCVGCGICASVCPRGVLKLENDGTNVLDRLNKTKTSFIKESEIQRILDINSSLKQAEDKRLHLIKENNFELKSKIS